MLLLIREEKNCSGRGRKISENIFVQLHTQRKERRERKHLILALVEQQKYQQRTHITCEKMRAKP